MKNWLPYRNYELKSPLLKEDALRSLASQVKAPQKGFFRFIGRGDGKFKGSVTGNDFRIIRAIAYRNSFLPIISGTIMSGDSGSTIGIKMRMHMFVVIFISIWMAVVGLAVLVAMPVLFTCRNFSSNCGAAAIPICMLVFAGLLTSFAFNFEAKKAETFLGDVFQAKRS